MLSHLTVPGARDCRYRVQMDSLRNKGTTTAWVVRFVVLMAGAVLMSLEVAAFRVIGKSFGTALRETTTVIAVFLVAMSIGYYVGGRIGDRWPRVTTLAASLLCSSAFLLAVPALESLLAPRIATSAAALSTHAFIVTTLLFAIPTALLAATSPIAVRLFERATQSGAVAGSISALSTIGSVLGTIGTAFFLLDWLQSIERTVIFLGYVALSLAAALLAVTSADWFPHARRARFATAAIVGCVLPPLAMPLFIGNGDSVSLRTPNTRVLHERDSGFQNIRVTQRNNVRDLYIDGTLHSRMYLGDKSEAGFAYNEVPHLARVIRPSTRRIAIIGMGGGTLAKQFSRFYEDTRVDAVEVDPAVVTVARDYFDVRPTPRLNIEVSDGRMFIERTTERYDLITVDTYTRGRYGATIPPHLTSREFFLHARDRLTEGGMFHFHSFAHRDAPISRALYKTLRSVFPTVLVFGSTEFLATADPLFVDARYLQDRASALRVHLPHIDLQIQSLQTTPLPTADVPVLTDDHAPVERLLRNR